MLHEANVQSMEERGVSTTLQSCHCISSQIAVRAVKQRELTSLNPALLVHAIL